MASRSPSTSPDGRRPRDRAIAAGVELSSPPAAGGHYQPVVINRGLAYVAGQTAHRGPTLISGRLGAELDLGRGKKAAWMCMENVLAQLDAAIGLNEVSAIVRLSVFVAAVAEFTEHSAVADSASELASEVFAGTPVHVRTTVGVISLPRGSAVEIEAIAAILEG